MRNWSALISPYFGCNVLFRVYFCKILLVLYAYTYGERKSICTTKQLSHKREFNLYNAWLLSWRCLMMCHLAVDSWHWYESFHNSAQLYDNILSLGGIGTHMKASCTVHSYKELYGQTTDWKSLFNITQFSSKFDLFASPIRKLVFWSLPTFQPIRICSKQFWSGFG